MQTHIILQNIATFRVDWKTMYRPDQYRLVLIVSPANHQRLLAAAQDKYFHQVVETDDFSLENLARLTRRTLQELDLTDLTQVRIVTHDEYSLGVAAHLREELGIDGDRPEQLRSFVDKIEMKRALAGKGIRLPKHFAFDAEQYRSAPDAYADLVERELGFPVFVKPVNESGSVGAEKIESREELVAWCDQHRDDDYFEVDEFIDGKLYHCDTFIRDGRILFTQVSEYAHPCFDYLAGEICASLTLPHGSEDFRLLSDFAARVIAAIPAMPRNTVTHLEVFKNADGELIFLEIAARAPAAMVPYTYAKFLGVNIEEAHFRLQMGTFDGAEFTKRGPYCAWVYFPHQEGFVTELHKPKLRSQHEISWRVKVGDRLQNPKDIRDTACTVMLWNDDFDELKRDFDYLDKSFRPYSVAQVIPACLDPLKSSLWC